MLVIAGERKETAMNEKEIIERNLSRYFELNGNKRVVVLPLRNLSGMVSDILYEKFGVREQFIVDNNAYDMKHIYPMNQMPAIYKECTFFLAAFGNTKKILNKQLTEYVPEKQIVDLLFDEEREKVFASNAKVHLDFLCPGFGKCGTTSLHYALARNPKIFLPSVKETHFLRYSVNENTHETFKSQYKEEDIAGKLVGEIEPAYRGHAEDVYRYFGGDLKLIFCVRNPVDTLYSYFKMEMRNEIFMLGSKSSGAEIMDGFERITPEVFDRWAMKYKYRGLYPEHIRSYLEYYPAEQMKIIVSEELYADTYNGMEELQNFLGIPEADKIKYREFPRENAGSKVAKDQKGLEINMSIGQLRRKLMRQGDAEALDMLQDIAQKVEEFTMVDYDEPMWESTRLKLMDYYMDSIYELEGMLERSLQGVWYDIQTL